jgi:hypothetical protein
MEEEKYLLSVRLWHPTLQAEEIAKNIEGIPCTAHTVGENFITPSGTITDRINKETYVVYYFRNTQKNDLYDALEIANSFLYDNINYFSEFKKSGGRCDYYITIVSRKMYAFVLDPKIINDCAKLGIEIWVEIFAEAE